VELFSSNDIALYRRDRITLQKGKEAVNSYSSATAQVCCNKRRVLLELENETIQCLITREGVQELFPIKRDEIAVFLRRMTFL
jgi:hypothetical protein